MGNQLSNYTTIEQSRELLSIGLPEKTSDCYYSYKWTDLVTTRPIGPYIKKSDWITVVTNQDFPCWSAGRLMEIYLKCHEDLTWCAFDFSVSESDNIIDKLIERFKTSDSKFDYSAYDN